MDSNVHLLSGQCINGYCIERLIGVGAFSTVYLATNMQNMCSYAIKYIHKVKSSMPSPSICSKDIRRLKIQRQEVLFHRQVNNIDGVLKLVESFELPDGIFLVLEATERGDLCELLTDEWMDPRDIKNWFMQILETMSACHDLHIYHRDLKPENILIMNDGKTVKVCDFGLATNESISHDYGIGTSAYMSPDIFSAFSPHKQQQQHQHQLGYRPEKGDLWSLGVLLFGMVTRKTPWSEPHFGDPGFRRFSIDPLKTLLSFNLSSNIIEILFMCWGYHLDKRKCNIKSILHEFSKVSTQELLGPQMKVLNCEDDDSYAKTQTKLKDIYISWASLPIEYDMTSPDISLPPQLSPILETRVSNSDSIMTFEDDEFETSSSSSSISAEEKYEDDTVVSCVFDTMSVLYNDEDEDMVVDLNVVALRDLQTETKIYKTRRHPNQRKPRFSLNEEALQLKKLQKNWLASVRRLSLSLTLSAAAEAIP